MPIWDRTYIPHYVTAQLQGNVHTRPRRILHTFQMHPAQVPDVSRIWQKGVALMYVLLQLYCEVLHCTDISHAHYGCTSHVFRMCLGCILDVCGRYLGAELYCILSYLLSCYVT